MAQRLRMKFSHTIRFWRYTVDDYLEALLEKEISTLSISKLGSIAENE
jgi:hypothetical protein